MFKKALAAVTASALLCGTATPAHAIVGGHEVTDTDPWARNVVQLGACTGTIIAPHWVLTAEHCSPAPAHQPHIDHGLNRPHSQTGSKRYNTDRKLKAPSGDILLLHTVQAMDTEAFPEIYSGTPKFRDRGVVYGWGGGTEYRLKYADAAFSQLHSSSTTHGGNVVEMQYLDGAQARRGDSGGPLFIDGKLAGVTSSTLHAGRILVDFAELTPHAEWIAQTISPPNTAAPVPEQPAEPAAPSSPSESSAPETQPEHPEHPSPVAPEPETKDKPAPEQPQSMAPPQQQDELQPPKEPRLPSPPDKQQPAEPSEPPTPPKQQPSKPSVPSAPKEQPALPSRPAPEKAQPEQPSRPAPKPQLLPSAAPKPAPAPGQPPKPQPEKSQGLTMGLTTDQIVGIILGALLGGLGLLSGIGAFLARFLR
ncbi:S1 family peptidase [Corynebacterium phocae]|uniref:S1 family peptidase n=1 Tax=Corynebacterium phocae TaxID=161895 RepID=UPI00095366BF|nr:S1 family peptidase [Corynebacterium phocae]KAA8726932.1 trypsin-like serine protease [Corynebacterium phocae]